MFNGPWLHSVPERITWCLQESPAPGPWKCLLSTTREAHTFVVYVSAHVCVCELHLRVNLCVCVCVCVCV